jgi:hypothetical protein
VADVLTVALPAVRDAVAPAAARATSDNSIVAVGAPVAAA